MYSILNCVEKHVHLKRNQSNLLYSNRIKRKLVAILRKNGKRLKKYSNKIIEPKSS